MTPETPDLILEDFMNLYRTPTADEHLDLPIQCVVRNSNKHEWEPALLVAIIDHQIKKFVTVPSDTPPTKQYSYAQHTSYKFCRIRNKQPAPITRPASAESIVDPPTPPEMIPTIPKATPVLVPTQAHIGLLVQVRDYDAESWSEPTVLEDVSNLRSLFKAKGVYWKYAKLVQPETTAASVESSESTKPLQSHVAARFDCIDPVVLKLLAECLGFGAAKYYPYSYHRIPVDDHINHALNHINEHRRLSQETRIDPADEMHLVNALARITFAISCLAQQGKYPTTYSHPEQNK
jgi:hypothetical protein